MFRKTIVTVTILHPVEDSPEGMPLALIGHEIDEGDWLGQIAITSSEPVSAEAIEAECRALGNDGQFFHDL